MVLSKIRINIDNPNSEIATLKSEEDPLNNNDFMAQNVIFAYLKDTAYLSVLHAQMFS